MEGPVLAKPDWPEYALLDCGNGRKLERFGQMVLNRPEPKAWWPLRDPGSLRKADAEFLDRGSWRMRNPNAPRVWTIDYQGITLEARLTEMSKHVGIFPEQEAHWRWIREEISQTERTKVLNLFGYTGVASLVAGKAGGEVTHVDASKPSLSWARHNQELSGMTKLPLRWLLDDAFKFVQREIRRGKQYDLLLLDPPSFGRGPKGEVWKVDDQIVDFFGHLVSLLRDGKGSIVMTLYNLEASSVMLANLAEAVLPNGRIEFGELVLPVEKSSLQLPLSLYVRWKRE